MGSPLLIQNSFSLILIHSITQNHSVDIFAAVVQPLFNMVVVSLQNLPLNKKIDKLLTIVSSFSRSVAAETFFLDATSALLQVEDRRR